MCCNFYLAKNHKIAENLRTTYAIEKINTDLESLKFLIFFDMYLTKFKNNQILPNKISHRFLLTTKLLKAYLHEGPILH